MTRNESRLETDDALLARCREGDTDAYAELWERHRRAALVAARSIAPSLDPDDLVAEAYAKILGLLTEGRGPQGAFRPYLYRVIRSLAVDEFRSPEQTGGELEEIPDLTEAGPWEDNAFDRNAAARAFASLDERWQAVLWYTEVEGMPPREAAKLLHLSPNGVSALAARARDALRSAWVEAHVDREVADAECRDTLEHLQRYQRGRLTAGLRRRVEEHLDTCSSCRSAAREYTFLNERLALVLASLFVGGGAAASLLGGFNSTAAAALPHLEPAGTARGAGAPSPGHEGAGTASGSGASASTTAGAAGATSTTLVSAAVSAVVLAVVGVGVAVGMTLSSTPPPPVPAEATGQDRQNGTSPEGAGIASGERSEGAERDAPADATFDSPGAVPSSASDLLAADADASVISEADGTASAGGGSDRGQTVSESSTAGSARADASGSGSVSPGASASGTASTVGTVGTGGLAAATATGASEAASDAGSASAEGDSSGTPPVGDGSDPSLAVTPLCYAEDREHPGSYHLTGLAPEYGVIRARITEGAGGTPVPVVPPGNEEVDDGRGNIFTNILTGTDPETPHWWWAPSLTPLSQWGLGDASVDDVLVELRFVTPDGRYSPWVALDSVARCW